MRPVPFMKKVLLPHLNDECAGKIEGLLTNAGKKAKEATSFISHKMATVTDKVSDRMLYMRKGYTASDIWNLGDGFLDRWSNICGYLADANYETVDLEYIENILTCEKVFRACEVFDNITTEAMGADLIGFEREVELDKKAHKEMILPWWMWIYDTLLDPDKFVSPEPPRIGKKIDISGAISAGSRLVGQIGYDDVRDLPVSETKRMSRLFYKCVNDSHSYPSPYLTSDNTFQTLEERGGDAWLNGTSLALGLMTHTGREWQSDMWHFDNGYYSQKTRKEIGSDWAAWVEDLLHAAEILGLYSQWYGLAENMGDGSRRERKPAYYHSLSVRDAMIAIDREAAMEIEKDLREETRKVWAWIGKNIKTLWD